MTWATFFFLSIIGAIWWITHMVNKRAYGVNLAEGQCKYK